MIARIFKALSLNLSVPGLASALHWAATTMRVSVEGKRFLEVPIPPLKFRGPVLCFALLLVWVASAPPLFAQEEETDPASFFIETISVEGARHASTKLVLSESLLVPGRSYAESELRLGVYRIKRLPFILDARFSLRKGSARGFYDLLITVEEPRRFFLGLDVTAAPQEDWSGVGRGTVGLRAFAGANGVAFVALEGDELRAGYTHYNLFGKRLFASLEVGGKSSCCTGVAFDFGPEDTFVSGSLGAGADPFELILEGDSTEKLALTLGLPIGKSQGLRFVLRNEASDKSDFTTTLNGSQGQGELQGLAERTRRQEAELRWLLDTTDDPVVASRGRWITAALAGVDNERRTSLVSFSGGDRLERRETSRSFEARAAMRQYWPLAKEQALSLGWEVTLARKRVSSSVPGVGFAAGDTTDSDSEVWVGYSRNLWSRELAKRYGDLRLEVRLSPGVTASTSSDHGESSFEVGLTSQIEASVVYRSGWGLFRLRLVYDSEEE